MPRNRFTDVKTESMSPHQLADLDDELRREREEGENNPPFRYRIAVEWHDDERVYIASVPTLSCEGRAFSPSAAVRLVERAARALLDELKAKKKRAPKPDVAAEDIVTAKPRPSR